MPAYVCRHLIDGRNLGFLTSETPGEELPNAWCGDCEGVRVTEGGEWNDRSEAFAQVTMICSRCMSRQEHAIARKKKWWKFGKNS